MEWLFLSAGKTSITLTAIGRLIDDLKVYGALVIAPRLVAETVWRQEVAKWSHLRGLRTCLLRGPKEQKLRDLHRRDCDIWIINFESIPWLVRALNDQFLARGRYLPFNMLVIDESDRLKNAQGVRFKELELLLQDHFAYRVGLTGTPIPNGFIDLHGQYLVIDGGERLYKNIGDFRTKWFRPGYAMQTWSLAPGAEEEIQSRIADITLSMRSEDYLKLPDYQYFDHWVDLDPKTQREYDRLEKEYFAQLDRHEDDPVDGEWDLEVHCVLSARAKCRQVANGAVLHSDNSGAVMLVHDLKLEVLDSIMHEAAGSPIFLSYLYRHDMHRIKERYTKQGYKVGYLGPGVKDPSAVVNAWNAGQYPLLMAHPASAAHGVNLQGGGSEIAWFSPTDSLSFWLQFNGRIRRQGQTASNVRIRRILTRNTVDELLVALIETKDRTQENLRSAIAGYRRKKS
jgi:hypothetical protein